MSSRNERLDKIFENLDRMQGIHPIALLLFEQLHKPEEERTDIHALARKHLEEFEGWEKGENGLVAYLFISKFRPHLNLEHLQKLSEQLESARSRPGSLVEAVIDRSSIVEQEARKYLSMHQAGIAVEDYDYIMVKSTNNPLADMLISLEHTLAAANLLNHFSNQVKKPNIVVESFVESEKGILGIWVSSKGILYHPEKLGPLLGNYK